MPGQVTLYNFGIPITAKNMDTVELLWPSAPTRRTPYILRTLQHKDMGNNVFCGPTSYFLQDSIEERPSRHWPHSFFKLSTGFVSVAFTVCRLSVSTATTAT